jgi:hypothetical protein
VIHAKLADYNSRRRTVGWAYSRHDACFFSCGQSFRSKSAGILYLVYAHRLASIRIDKRPGPLAQVLAHKLGEAHTT